MLVYVVIASQDGNPLDPAVVERVAQVDLPELPFTADQYLTWTNRDKTVHFSGWQAFTETGQIGSHWHTDYQTLTAFSGLPAWIDGAWPPGQPWASYLAQAWQQSAFTDLCERLHGMYTAVQLRQNGEGIVTSDPLSVALLYHAQLPGAHIVSNRANLAARAMTPTGQTPYRDWRSAGWLLFTRNSFGLETGFSGVSVLPQSGYLHIQPHGRAEIRVWTQTPWAYPEGASRPDTMADVIDELDGYFRGAIRSLASLPFQRRELRLSGGKDSRLLLALILSENLQNRFTILTYGHRDGLDNRTAIELGRQFGFDVEFDDRTALDTEQMHHRIRVHTHQVSGADSAWDTKGGTLVLDDICISASMSGSIRPGSMSRPLTEGHHDPLSVLRDPRLFDRLKLLSEPAATYFQQQIEDHLQQSLAILSNPSDYGLIHAKRVSGRRWQGMHNEISPVPWAIPYFDHRAMRPMFRISTAEVLSERIPFELMRRASPKLAKMAFVGSVWPPEAYSLDPEANVIAQVQRVSSGRKKRDVQWRVTNFGHHRDFFHDYLSNRSNPIYEFADRDTIMDVLYTEPIAGATLPVLYGVLTGAIWLGGYEQADRIKRFNDVSHSAYDLGQKHAVLKRRNDLPENEGGESPAVDPISRSKALIGSGPGLPLTRDARVCALIPHFQAESFLADAIDSLAKQTRPLQAIVVIDDNSPSAPAGIVTAFPGVTLLRSDESSGPYRLIQEVIDNTDFDAYLFQDADDWSSPERLELLLAEAVRTGAEMVGSQGYRVILEESEVVTYFHAKNPDDALATGPASKPVHHPTTLVSRDLIMRIGGFGTGFRYSGDAEFLRRAGHVTRLANVPNLLYTYRTRRDSLTGSDETGNHTPVRRMLWEVQHARATSNAERRAENLPPILDPMAVAAPVKLTHCTGPALSGTDGQWWPTGSGTAHASVQDSPRLTLSEPAAAPNEDPRSELPRPVFVIGAPRSGTSILALSLAQHSSFSPMLDLSWISRLASSLQQVYTTSTEQPVSSDLTIHNVENESYLAHFGKAIDQLQVLGPDPSAIPEDDVLDAPGLRRLTRSQKVRRSRWIAEGSELANHAFALNQLFPHCRFIHVLRDPAGVVESLTADNARLYRSRYLHYSEIEAYDLWDAHVKTCRKIETAFGAQRVLRVEREALLESPREQLETIFQFLQEPFEPAAMRPFRS